MRLRTFSVIVAVCFAGNIGAQSRTTTRDASAIQSAQSVYREVELSILRHELARHDTTVTCRTSGLEAHGSIYLDDRRRARRIDTEAGTDDHSESINTYYDTLGRARFAFGVRGAVNGTAEEERVYFAEDGRVVRRLVRRTKAPGYSFSTITSVPKPAAWVRFLCRE